MIGESFIPGVTPSFSSVNSQICKLGIAVWLTDDSRILLEYINTSSDIHYFFSPEIACCTTERKNELFSKKIHDQEYRKSDSKFTSRIRMCYQIPNSVLDIHLCSRDIVRLKSVYVLNTLCLTRATCRIIYALLHGLRNVLLKYADL